MITDNILEIKNRIINACEKCGRDPKEVQLICVSKTKPMSDIIECYEYGERHYGENKVQEMVDKYENLPKDINWHLIGHLQRNKVKYIVGKTKLIHSVDSLRLLEQIEKSFAKENLIAHVLLEINVAGEDSKFGYTAESVMDDLEAISKFEHIQVDGLMTVAPFTDDPESNRQYFKKLKALSVDIEAKKYNNISMKELSMGMTGDFEIAIEEGATFVRVGTAIFGQRNYMI